MTAALEMPRVSECTVAGCSYNDHSHCHAFAITVAGHDGDAECATFIPLSVKGGLPMVSGQVGACQRADCVHNVDLTCHASAVRIGAHADMADCLTFQPR